jgi:hypothetical protein
LTFGPKNRGQPLTCDSSVVKGRRKSAWGQILKLDNRTREKWKTGIME